MTRLQLDYAQYIENRRHSLQQEALDAQKAAEIARANRASEANAARSIANAERATSINAEYTAAEIEKAKASIRQADKTLELKESQQNWQQQIDRFNANLASQKNMIEKDKLALDKDKFNNSKNQWNAEYAQKRREYDLAVKQFKADKTDKTWKNVLATSKELRSWMEGPLGAVTKAAANVVSSAAKKATKK